MIQLISSKRLFFYGILTCITVQTGWHIYKDHAQLDIVDAAQNQMLWQQQMKSMMGVVPQSYVGK